MRWIVALWLLIAVPAFGQSISANGKSISANNGSGGAATSIIPGTTTIGGATAPCYIGNSTGTVMVCTASTGIGNIVRQTSPTVSGLTDSTGSTLAALNLSSITGSTQCLTVDTLGNVSGTGAACNSISPITIGTSSIINGTPPCFVENSSGTSSACLGTTGSAGSVVLSSAPTLTGTTSANAITVTGAGASLQGVAASFSGNVTVGSVLTATGGVTSTGTLNVGGTGTATSVIANQGTGNFRINVDGASTSSSFLVYFAGVLKLDIGGSSNDYFQVNNNIALNPGAGSPVAGNHGFFMNDTWNDAVANTPASTQYSFNTLQVVDQTGSTTQGSIAVLAINQVVGTSNALGVKAALSTNISVNSTTGNNTGVGGVYIAVGSGAQTNVNDNGTATNFGTQFGGLGHLYAGNPVVHLGPSATYYYAADVTEFDIEADAGSSVNVKRIVGLDRIGNDVSQGAWIDEAMGFNAADTQTAGVGWRVLISVGDPQGFFPMDTTGTVIKAGPVSSGTMLIGTFIDFSNVTASSYWEKFGTVWDVDASGDLASTGTLTLSGISTSGTIAGSVCMTAGKLLLYESGATGCTISLEELKQDIKPVAYSTALHDVMSLNPIAYNMKENDPGRRMGFGARQVNSVDPLLSTHDGRGQLQAYDPNGIIAELVAVVQHQQREIEALNNRP